MKLYRIVKNLDVQNLFQSSSFPDLSQTLRSECDVMPELLKQTLSMRKHKHLHSASNGERLCKCDSGEGKGQVLCLTVLCRGWETIAETDMILSPSSVSSMQGENITEVHLCDSVLFVLQALLLAQVTTERRRTCMMRLFASRRCVSKFILCTQEKSSLIEHIASGWCCQQWVGDFSSAGECSIKTQCNMALSGQ